MKRNKVILVIIVLCLFVLLVVCWLIRMNSAEKYLLYRNNEAVEVLFVNGKIKYRVFRH